MKTRKLSGLKMSLPHSEAPVIIIVGPTAVGKTAFAISLAQRFQGEIISADSRYLYRGMDIGTAKPTAADLAKAPHHMVDIADPGDTFSLPQYLEETFALMHEIHARERIPIIVGGTGQYTRALIEGWQIPEIEPNESLRKWLQDWGDEIGALALHQKLGLLDSEAANMIDASNLRRTIRALEVVFSTGKKFSELRIKDGPAYRYHVIGLTMDRGELYQRVDERIDLMLVQGFEEEVRTLLAKGYTAEYPAMSAIGYREMIQYLQGEIDLEAAKALMRKNTRRLIRRQNNWYKATDPHIRWYDIGSDTINQVIKDLQAIGVFTRTESA